MAGALCGLRAVLVRLISFSSALLWGQGCPGSSGCALLFTCLWSRLSWFVWLGLPGHSSEVKTVLVRVVGPPSPLHRGVDPSWFVWLRTSVHMSEVKVVLVRPVGPPRPLFWGQGRLGSYGRASQSTSLSVERSWFAWLRTSVPFSEVRAVLACLSRIPQSLSGDQGRLGSSGTPSSALFWYQGHLSAFGLVSPSTFSGVSQSLDCFFLHALDFYDRLLCPMPNQEPSVCG